jgi:hypothetical protein
MRKPLKRLKREHLTFCALYAEWVPPAVAYAKAFGKGDGPDAHPGNAARLLREPLVQAEIRRLTSADEAAGNPAYIGYRRALLRAELDRIAFFRLPDVLDEGLHLKPLAELTDDQRAAIAEISVDADGRRKVKAHSKDAAIAQLIKLDGLAEPDKVVLGGDIAVTVKDARAEVQRRLAQLAAAGGAG